jgi:hypothetical protein
MPLREVEHATFAVRVTETVNSGLVCIICTRTRRNELDSDSAVCTRTRRNDLGGDSADRLKTCSLTIERGEEDR